MASAIQVRCEFEEMWMSAKFTDSSRHASLQLHSSSALHPAHARAMLEADTLGGGRLCTPVALQEADRDLFVGRQRMRVRQWRGTHAHAATVLLGDPHVTLPADTTVHGVLQVLKPALADGGRTLVETKFAEFSVPLEQLLRERICEVPLALAYLSAEASLYERCPQTALNMLDPSGQVAYGVRALHEYAALDIRRRGTVRVQLLSDGAAAAAGVHLERAVAPLMHAADDGRLALLALVGTARVLSVASAVAGAPAAHTNQEVGSMYPAIFTHGGNVTQSFTDAFAVPAHPLEVHLRTPRAFANALRHTLARLALPADFLEARAAPALRAAAGADGELRADALVGGTVVSQACQEMANVMPYSYDATYVSGDQARVRAAEQTRVGQARAGVFGGGGGGGGGDDALERLAGPVDAGSDGSVMVMFEQYTGTSVAAGDCEDLANVAMRAALALQTTDLDELGAMDAATRATLAAAQFVARHYLYAMVMGTASAAAASTAGEQGATDTKDSDGPPTQGGGGGDPLDPDQLPAPGGGKALVAGHMYCVAIPCTRFLRMLEACSGAEDAARVREAFRAPRNGPSYRLHAPAAMARAHTLMVEGTGRQDPAQLGIEAYLAEAVDADVAKAHVRRERLQEAARAAALALSPGLLANTMLQHQAFAPDSTAAGGGGVSPFYRYSSCLFSPWFLSAHGWRNVSMAFVNVDSSSSSKARAGTYGVLTADLLGNQGGRVLGVAPLQPLTKLELEQMATHLRHVGPEPVRAVTDSGERHAAHVYAPAVDALAQPLRDAGRLVDAAPAGSTPFHFMVAYPALVAAICERSSADARADLRSIGAELAALPHDVLLGVRTQLVTLSDARAGSPLHHDTGEPLPLVTLRVDCHVAEAAALERMLNLDALVALLQRGGGGGGGDEGSSAGAPACTSFTLSTTTVSNNIRAEATPLRNGAAAAAPMHRDTLESAMLCQAANAQLVHTDATARRAFEAASRVHKLRAFDRAHTLEMHD